ncbi:hypothetical protein WJX81_000704 [Elliptochloris bilobata]|uniref:LisH domain-containing protein n=1 Tax=Elliptochloris bilobata TaxID=381761 RepID=A0AAW1S044_9CHLO
MPASGHVQNGAAGNTNVTEAAVLVLQFLTERSFFKTAKTFRKEARALLVPGGGGVNEGPAASGAPPGGELPAHLEAKLALLDYG